MRLFRWEYLPCKRHGFNSRTPGGVRQKVPDDISGVVDVSIHAPREGCDRSARLALFPYRWFQFTHPGRGATIVDLQDIVDLQFQFTHPGRGATPPHVPLPPRQTVSIHAPREGCDYIGDILDDEVDEFQFTHPGRGATAYPRASVSLSRVSIHAPREGCDGVRLLFVLS